MKKVKDNGDIEYRNAGGDLHREDGPAVIDALNYKAWYLNGEQIPEEMFNKLMGIED